MEKSMFCRRKSSFSQGCWFAVLILFVFLCGGCSHPGPKPDNYPYEPDTPVPAAHEGIFVSDHGSMDFNGDGESVVIDFDRELSELTGLPEGRQKGKYVFLSGDLPPHGSMPVRYDIAHELEITAAGQSAVVDLGIAAEDGKSGQVGVNVVTPDRIPMLFSGSGFRTVEFLKEDHRSVLEFFFQESYGSDYDMWEVFRLDYKDGTYTAVIKPGGVKEEDTLTVEVDESFAVRLAGIFREYDVYSWNGFDKRDPDIMDGIAFTLQAVMTDNSKLSAQGYMEWPEGYNKAAGAIQGLFQEVFDEETEKLRKDPEGIPVS